MRIETNDIILQNADYVMTNEPLQGHNGPYNDLETKVRIYSHWSILLIKAFSISGDRKYRDRAIGFINYLFTKKARPYEFTFYNRNSNTKDKCNGLIGQAWAIEALMYANEVLNDLNYIKLAEHIFLLHSFNKALGFWRKREIDGTKLWFDMTFNHQLWFAMAGSLIGNDVISRQINRFMERLNRNLQVYDNGLIRHFVYAGISTPIYLVKNKILNTNISKINLYEKEVGYHAFNCYALSLLKGKYPNHKFWNSRKLKKVLDFTLRDEHLLISNKSKYGFSYNPSGIETAFLINSHNNYRGGKNLNRRF